MAKTFIIPNSQVFTIAQHSSMSQNFTIVSIQ
jgi:hypothetical protein